MTRVLLPAAFICLLTGCGEDFQLLPPKYQVAPTGHIASAGSVSRGESVTPVDETAAVQALLNAGGNVQLECRNYYFSGTLTVTQSGTTLQGCGASTVLHWTAPGPKVQRVGCKNDRAIAVLCGISFYTPHEIKAPVAIGDQSMEVADSSGIQAGDWLMVGDWGVLGTYTSVVDWVQVAAVNGTTISFLTPVRVAISTDKPFTPYASGAGFVRMIPLHDVTLQDFTVDVAPPAPGTANFAAVGVTGTTNTTFQRLTINDPAGNPLWTYYSKGTRILDCVGSGASVGTEIASSVDFTMSGNQLTGVGLSLDLGTAFFTVSGNNIASPVNVGIYSTLNVHDGAISGNTIGYVGVNGGVANAVGIYLQGSPNVNISGNSLAGGAGNSIGIIIAPQTSGQFSWSDTGDVLSNNNIQGFTTQVRGP